MLKNCDINQRIILLQNEYIYIVIDKVHKSIKSVYLQIQYKIVTNQIRQKSIFKVQSLRNIKYICIHLCVVYTQLIHVKHNRMVYMSITHNLYIVL